MATCAVGERAIGYERSGAGPPIVVINGFAATRAGWDPDFIAGLAAGNELVLLDNRGMGESSADSEGFTIEDLAMDTAGAIESLGLERPCVLGWSMGGFIALALVLARPELVGSLVLLSAHAGAGSTPASDAVYDRLHDLSGTPREQATRLISLLFTPERATDIDAAFGNVVAEARARLDHTVVEHQWEAMGTWAEAGVTDRLGEIACPALVATGTEDVICPPENAFALASGIDDAWLARFPHSGHGFIADRPVAVARLVAAFLAAGR